MKWTEEEKQKLEARIRGTGERWKAVDRAVFVADLALELAAARGGTMTAEDVAKLHEFYRSPEGLAIDPIWEHLAAQGARMAVLEEKLAEMEGASILDKNAIRLQRERAEQAEERIRQLAIAGQELSAAVDRHTGEPQCSNSDPATGPTCAEHVAPCPLATKDPLAKPNIPKEPVDATELNATLAKWGIR